MNANTLNELLSETAEPEVSSLSPSFLDYSSSETPMLLQTTFSGCHSIPGPDHMSSSTSTEPPLPRVPPQEPTDISPTPPPVSVDKQPVYNHEVITNKTASISYVNDAAPTHDEITDATALANSLLNGIASVEDGIARQIPAATCRPTANEKTTSVQNRKRYCSISEKWCGILESPAYTKPQLATHITQLPISAAAAVLSAATLQYAISPSAIAHDAHVPSIGKPQRKELRVTKPSKGRVTRYRKMSKREASKAATAAARTEIGMLAHLAKTNQITDDQLLTLKPKKPRRVAKFSKPVPSRFCHICSRKPNSVRVAVCPKIKDGTCRKVICEKCFQLYRYGNFVDAMQTDTADWLCPHCDNNCPDRAQCRTYQRANARIRLKRLKRELPNGRP